MDYSKLNGLIPAVIQDAESSEVLMVGFMFAVHHHAHYHRHGHQPAEGA